MGQRAPATASLGADSLRILLGCPGGPSGGAEEEQARSARVLSGPSEGQALPDGLTLSLTEVLQTNVPETLRIKLELDGESHILELLRNRELVPGRPALVWYEPDGTRVVSEGHTLVSLTGLRPVSGLKVGGRGQAEGAVL